MSTPSFILASASPRRLELLKQLGLAPVEVMAASIDETQKKTEQPRIYAARMAREKAELVAAKKTGVCVLGADTVVACGRRILDKTEDEEEARKHLQLLSGRRHRVYSAVAVVDAEGKLRERVSLSMVQFKKLTDAEIRAYLATGEWRGKAGAYAVQGKAAAFIARLDGSYSGVMGLPLYETMRLLEIS